MKALTRYLIIVLMAVCGLQNTHAQTYELQIDSVVGIPDTVANGDTVTFYLQVSMNSPLFYQGDIYIELEYNNNFYEVDNTLSQNFLSPNTPNAIEVMHRFSTDDDLSIGDNVVVVWPRIGDGVSPPQTVINPYTTTVTIVEPNGIDDAREQRTFQPFLYPNPTTQNVLFKLKDNLQVSRSVLYDMYGKVLVESDTNLGMDVSQLPPGLYFVDVMTLDGHIYSDKLLIAH